MNKKAVFIENLKALLLSLLTAVLIVLSFPKPNIYLLIWISLIPVLFVITGKSLLRSLTFGFIAGLAANLGLFYWMFISVFGQSNFFFEASISYIVPSIYLAVYNIGIWAFLLRFVGTSLSPLNFSVFSAAIWVSMEYIRAQLMTGFPWALLGYSQWKFLPVIQISEYTGVFGVTFLIVFFNTCLFKAIKTKKYGILAWSTFFLAVIVIYGHFTVKSNTKNLDSLSYIKTVSIQPNIEQNKKWEEENIDEIKGQFLELITKASKETPDLIIWPETAVPGYLPGDNELYEWVSSVVKKTNTYHLIGAPYREKGENRRVYYNAAFLFNPQGEIVKIHKKINLVPFAEFVPLGELFPGLGFLNKLGQCAPGTETTILPLPALSNEGNISPDVVSKGIVNIGATICSDNYYGNLVRQATKKDADILINQTNDAWFFDTSAPYQHFTMNVFRAIENRRVVLASGNTGITGVVEPSGFIKQQIPILTADYMVSSLPVESRNKRTFYVKFGDVFAKICMFITLLYIGIWFRAKKVNKSNIA